MKNKRPIAFMLILAAFFAAVALRAEVSFGLNINSAGPESFYLNVSNYYRVPEAQVMVIHEQRMSDEEIPVVLYLASQAHVGPEIIIRQRLGGLSWMDIALAYHLNAGIFYVPFSRDPGPPYGRAYGYYRHHRRGDWGKIRLADEDVVNMVNLRFVSEHYGYRPDEVAQYRGHGGSFHKVGKKGQGGGDNVKGGRDDDKYEGKGHGKGGKSHGQGHGKK